MVIEYNGHVICEFGGCMTFINYSKPLEGPSRIGSAEVLVTRNRRINGTGVCLSLIKL